MRDTIIGLGVILVVVFVVWFVRMLMRSRNQHVVSSALLTSSPAIDEAVETTSGRDDVVSPSGLRVIASAGPKRKPLPPSTDSIVIVRQAELKRGYECGHQGPEWFVLNTYGLETKQIKTSKPCPDCLITDFKKVCIRCALCGLIILPGDPVATYHIGSKAVRRDIATPVGDDAVIGCMRGDCCPSGGFFSGHWTLQGFRSAFSEGTASEHVMATGETVARGDISQPS